mmetsp:Transcript_123363/g.334986  ORF Transcript_123363/g.334986 Transcript_123363/m.334986 type:complete len:204 (-) Transcript_123363:763-1374(-)
MLHATAGVDINAPNVGWASVVAIHWHRVASAIGCARSCRPIRHVAVLDSVCGRNRAVPHQRVAHGPGSTYVRVEDLGHALLAVAHFGDISLIDVAVLLLFLAGCSGDRIDLGDGLSQHLREFHLVRPQSCDLLVHVLLLAFVGVPILLHDIGELIDKILELTPLQGHQIVEVTTIYFAIDTLPRTCFFLFDRFGRGLLPCLQQ